MIRRPPRSTRTYTLFPYTTLVRSPYQYQANPGVGTYKGELPSMEKLPEIATNGDMYKIVGSIESGFTSYYVRRNGAVWDETVANGLRNKLDATTMPHRSAERRVGKEWVSTSKTRWTPYL